LLLVVVVGDDPDDPTPTGSTPVPVEKDGLFCLLKGNRNRTGFDGAMEVESMDFMAIG
jgi:hypothetical protein